MKGKSEFNHCYYAFNSFERRRMAIMNFLFISITIFVIILFFSLLGFLFYYIAQSFGG